MQLSALSYQPSALSFLLSGKHNRKPAAIKLKANS